MTQDGYHFNGGSKTQFWESRQPSRGPKPVEEEGMVWLLDVEKVERGRFELSRHSV